MKQHVLEIAWLVQIASLVAMIVYVVSRPGIRALVRSIWKARGFRWVFFVFLAATGVQLVARLLHTLGL